MARSSYSSAKRQREIAKKKKKEEKRLKKLGPVDTPTPEGATPSTIDSPPVVD